MQRRLKKEVKEKGCEENQKSSQPFIRFWLVWYIFHDVLYPAIEDAAQGVDCDGLPPCFFSGAEAARCQRRNP